MGEAEMAKLPGNIPEPFNATDHVSRFTLYA
jgi:hypothetical protein